MTLNFEFIDKHYIEIIILMILVSVIFIVIGHEWRDVIQTPLKKSFVTIPKHDLDGWSLTHFLLFAFIGFVKPGYPLTFLFIGAGWEFLEDILAADKNTNLTNCMEKKNNFIQMIMCNGLQDDYWYGKWDDIIVNLVGYIVGSAIGDFSRKK